MPLLTRQEAEQLHHDRQAAERAEWFARHRQDLRFSDAKYLDHESWIRPALAHLGPLDGKRILDYGCGHGMAAVVLARQGAQVLGFDLAPGYVQEAQLRARANEVDAEFVVANAEELPFASGSFDGVWGNAILHHLDLPRAAAELQRVLRPGGVAVFCEPWGGNLLLELARRHLPYPGKARTEDEQPLQSHDLAELRKAFPKLRFEAHQLLGMVRRVLPGRMRLRLLEVLDQVIFRAIPASQRWCRYAVVILPKEA